MIVYKYVDMKHAADFFKLLSDQSRLRILMLLTRRDLCVCQLMGVLGIAQPLVSRNLSLLREGGLLEERRKGKLIFYSVKRDVPRWVHAVIRLLKVQMKNDETFTVDLQSLAECEQFQRKSGKCDMKTFLAYMETRRKKKVRGKVRNPR
jgi:ArsR family transcriptional regulator